MKFIVCNLPSNYTDYKYITARLVDDCLYYYGAWRDNYDGAYAQAVEINGLMLETVNVERGAF